VSVEAVAVAVIGLNAVMRARASRGAHTGGGVVLARVIFSLPKIKNEIVNCQADGKTLAGV
jgi:hypothetical protein